jgi:hypothetical protein
MNYGLDTLLCLSMFLLGSIGMFVMFWWTDRNAMADAERRAPSVKKTK